ncbi:MAG: TIGR02281 family clan AA aspartic protease [Desulfovibrionaceae bacterium]|jgi:aspartyl protease family protein|nr:TIGR02281 family clan AA aspartic protease [Desulfovibrionaceae bacterium]
MRRHAAVPTRARLPWAWLFGLAASALPLIAAAETSVSLQGLLGSKALLLVGSGAPHAVAPGETWQGVKVVSTGGEQAVVLVDGQRITLRVGEAPASIGQDGLSSDDRIALTADSRGHFFAQGSINDLPVRFLVDTGASVVAISQAEAERLGLNYKRGRQVRTITANGPAMGWVFRIPALRIGDVVSYEVDAIVTPAPMPMVLLGNSYLSRFNMRRDGDQMTLIKR